MRRRRRQGKVHQGVSFSFREEEKRLYALKEVIRFALITVVAASLAVLVVLGFGFRVRMAGDGMRPGIAGGQNVLVDRASYRVFSVDRYDVIAFYPGGNEDAGPSIRRVIGMPGDTVWIDEGAVLINGVPEMRASAYAETADGGLASTPIQLKSGEYFVMGDTRAGTEDSRSASIGNIRRETILGKVWLALPGGGNRLHRVR